MSVFAAKESLNEDIFRTHQKPSILEKKPYESLSILGLVPEWEASGLEYIK